MRGVWGQGEGSVGAGEGWVQGEGTVEAGGG